MSSKKISSFGIFVWSLAILFFFYEFFLRIFLGTIGDELSESLHLSIQQFSFVAAAYYVTYGVMQIPVGILTEKIGTRIILTSATLICTAGVFMLGAAGGFGAALISRLFIGFGSSFAFVALLILALNWFPKKYFGFLCGIALFLGAVGPMLAGAPLAYVYDLMEGNWRALLVWIGLFGVGLAVFLALFMRDKPKRVRQEILFITPHEPLRKKLVELLKNRQAWYVLLCSSFIYCPLPLLAAYFGTSYLQTVGFDRTASAFVISMVWVGYAVGSPLVGKVSDLVKRRTPFLYFFSLLGCIVSVCIFYLHLTNYALLITLFFLLGFATSSQGLAYALIVEHTPRKLHSAALGLNNTGGMLFGAIFPSICGFFIQMSLRASGRISLNSEDFLRGLSLIPLLYVASALCAFFLIKETYCREQHGVHKLEPHKASDLL